MIIATLYRCGEDIQVCWIKKTPEKTEILKKQLLPRAANQPVRNEYRPDKVILVLPRREISLKIINVPSRDRAEIEQMLPFELSGALPYKIEECCYDWTALETTSEGYSRVLAAIVRNKTIDEYLKVCRGLGLKVDVVGVSTQALWRSFASGENRGQGGYVLLYIAGNTADIIVARDKNIITSREIDFNNSDELLTELEKNIKGAAMVEPGFAPQGFVMNSSGDLAQWSKLLQERFGLAVAADNTLDILTGAAGFFDAGYKIINLLPAAEVNRRIWQRLKQQLALAGGLLCLICVLAFSLGLIKFQHLKARNTEADKILTRLEGASRDLEWKNQAIKLIKQQKGIYPQVVLDTLARLTQDAPAGLVFNSFTLDENKNIILRGESDNFEQFLQFADNLGKDAYFQNIEIKSTSRRQVKDQAMTNFELGLKLK